MDLSDGRRAIVYVVAPQCDWCERNYDNIISLAKAAKTEFRFVGIAHSTTLDQLTDHLAARPLPFDTYLLDREELIFQLSLEATPTMLALDGSGRIDEVWVGAWLGLRLKSVESFFRASLPGVPDLIN